MIRPIAFIGMETSGQFRRRFQALGIETYSADLLLSEDGGEKMAYGADGAPLGCHMAGDVFDVLDRLWLAGKWPAFGVFHPECTYATGAAAWAFADPDYDRYPGVGYHQRVKPGTLTGAERRNARDRSIAQFRRILALPFLKVIENPVGAFSSVMKPTQIVQPYEFGDDASKKTCLWMHDGDRERPDLRLPLDPARYVAPTLRANGSYRWANQTDTGQNRLSPSTDRWKDRSRTYDGIADAGAAHWAQFICNSVL